MTTTHPQPHFISVEDYLQGELHGDVRHEYVGGEIYAMGGASDRHNLIALNLATALRPHVRGTPCQLFIVDMKAHLKVAGEDTFYYPDLMLACDPEDRATYFRTKPCLIVEVLSKTTERIDRHEKLSAYTRIESLQEYLLLSQDHMEAEIHRRQEDWRTHRVTEGNVALTCLDLEIPLTTIYEDVPLA